MLLCCVFDLCIYLMKETTLELHECRSYIMETAELLQFWRKPSTTHNFQWWRCEKFFLLIRVWGLEKSWETNKRKNNHNLYPTFSSLSDNKYVLPVSFVRSLVVEPQRRFLPLVKSTNPIRIGWMLKEVDITCFQLLLSVFLSLSVNKLADVSWSVELLTFC
jgi:hypothetical protein